MKETGIFDLRLQPLQRLSEHIARHPACESKRILIIQVISSISLLVRLILHSLPDGYAFRVDLSDLCQSCSLFLRSRPFEHSQSICNGNCRFVILFVANRSPLGELFGVTDLSRRQKRLHNSDINLNGNSSSQQHAIETNKIKRQKSSKHRRLPESYSLLSLPSLFSSSTLTNDSSITLIASANPIFLATKRTLPDETAADADDEKDIRDESINATRCHRYHHQLSSSSHHRLKEQNITSEDDDEELLLRNHHGMMDFMDRVSRLSCMRVEINDFSLDLLANLRCL